MGNNSTRIFDEVLKTVEWSAMKLIVYVKIPVSVEMMVRFQFDHLRCWCLITKGGSAKRFASPGARGGFPSLPCLLDSERGNCQGQKCTIQLTRVYTIEYYHHFPSFLSNIQICKADFDVEMSKCGTTLFRVHSPVEPCKPVV